MSTITVRRVEAADLEGLQEHYPAGSLALAQTRLDEMAAGTGIFALAELDGQSAGSGFLDFADEKMTPEIKNLWVFPQFRRRGVGQALWGWLEEQARATGHKEVFLSVAPDNASAISFFLQLGYSPTGDHHFIEDPESHVVANPEQVASHYAIYQKSLRAY